MKTAFCSKFLEISFFEDKKILQVHWLALLIQMTNKEFKKQIEHEKNAVKTYKSTLIFANSLDFLFPISPALQDWHNDFLFSIFEETRVKKLAMFISKDIVAKISIEQLLDDVSAKKWETQYFDQKDKAFEWLLH